MEGAGHGEQDNSRQRGQHKRSSGMQTSNYLGVGGQDWKIVGHPLPPISFKSEGHSQLVSLVT